MHSFYVLLQEIVSRGRDTLVKLTLAYNLQCFFLLQSTSRHQKLFRGALRRATGLRLQQKPTQLEKKSGAPGWYSGHCAIP